ncbi:MAG: hypothetical protein J7639_00210 [Paenibacillaceae bacterium]|nr:hypothetical protein [Paenibacillaceae bacterium]
MRAEFIYDERLGIHIPELDREWEQYGEADRSAILEQWEHIRGAIPDRIMQLEAIIIAKQARLDREDDFAASCRLTWEIAEQASIINDLHIWYRTQQDYGVRMHM